MINDNSSSPRAILASFGLSAEIGRAALYAMSDGIFLFDREKRLVFVNDQVTMLQAGGNRPLIGRSCCEMFWQSTDGSTCIVERALESCQTVEFEVFGFAGIELPVFVTVRPLKEEGDGDPAGVMVTVRDISALRQAEAEAIAHKSFMASIADRSPDEIYALNKAGSITWVNERAETGNGVILLGQRFIDFVSPDSRDAVSESVNRALAGKDRQTEIRVLRGAEDERNIEANTSPLWQDGEVNGVLVFLRDITERKRTQELILQSDKLRAVGELAAGVAHNLNNSLTVIKGRAQLLQMRSADEASLKSLKVINDAVEDGSKTLRRILDFARRDSVQHFGPVELDELINSTSEIARPKWEKTGEGQIQMKIECNGPIYVSGDGAELREVILNLIFNAVDAMPDGGILEMGTRGEIASGCFWVADTGCGMKPETVARIFEPFFTTKGARGTGLGLSASHGIISRHRGEILAVSEPGEGTRFEVRLPISDRMSKFVKSEMESEAERLAAEVSRT